MNEMELKKHLERFRTGKRSGRYLLSVDSPKSSTGLWLSDSLLAWALCETAFKSRAAKTIQLLFYPDKDTEEVLFDSHDKELVEKIEQSLKRKAKRIGTK